MADDGVLDAGTETAALREVLAAEHAAVWGYGTVGAALPEDGREPAAAADGDRVLLQIAHLAKVDHLAVSPDGAPVIEELLRRYGSDAGHIL